MKIVIAPDSFKECLAASAVAQAIARGVLAVCGDAELDLCPMADGGEGTVEAMVAATGGRMMTADVFDPLGKPIRAHWGLLGSAGGPGLLPGELGLLGAVAEGEAENTPAGELTAVIEMAAASGLHLVPPELRDPLRTTTFGTGQLIRAAMDAGARKIILGIGGSSTVDGGCGAAQALGVTFLDKKGQVIVCGMGGGALSSIGKIDVSGIDPRLAGVSLRIACDVKNPMTGVNGAAAVYGPQKGATPEMVQQLDDGLAHLAAVLREQVGVDVEFTPGAGAAGGLGAGLLALAGGKLEPGLTMVAQAVGLKRRVANADLVFTGEGKLDHSSRFGKTAVGVCELARHAGARVICIPGQAAENAPRDLFNGVYPLVNAQTPPRTAMLRSQELLTERATQAMQDYLANRL